MDKKVKSSRKRRKKIRVIVTTIILVIIIAAAFILIPRFLNNNKDTSTGLMRTTAVVKRGEIARSMGVSSSIVPYNTENYKPAFGGEVLELNAEEGDYVSEGTIIMRLSTDVTDDLVESIQDHIENLETQIDNLNNSIENSHSSIEDYYDSIADINEDISDLNNDIALLEADKAENEALRDKLRIYSPINGTVFNLQVDEGDYVSPSTLLATITNPLAYEVEMPFSVNFLDKEIEEIIIHYKNSDLSAEIVSIADYTHTDSYGNELVDVILSFSRFAALPSDARVKGTIVTDPISYKCIAETAAYHSDTHNIFPEIQGEVISVNMAEKQSVEEGALIIVLDSQVIDDASESLDNQINGKYDQIESLRDSIDSAEEAITQLNDNIEGYKNDIAGLSEDIDELENDLTEAEEGYSEAELTAEFDGYVVNLSAEEGDEVTAGQSLFNLVSMARPKLYLTIDELDIPEIKEGLAAEVTIDALADTQDTPIPATVTGIALSGNTQGGVTTYTVTVELNESVDGLMPGMSGTGTIFISRKDNALFVPIEAVTMRNGKSYVWITTSEAEGKTTYDKSGYIDKSKTAGSGKVIGGKDTSKMTSEQKAEYDQWLKDQEQAKSESTADNDSFTTIEEYYEGASMVEITTGIHNETQIEILSGLKEGQIVLLPPVYMSDAASQSNNGFNLGTARKAMGGFGK